MLSDSGDRIDQNLFAGDTLDQIVKAYAEFLEVCARDQHRLFQLRVKNDLDAARSEAAIFSWLRAEGLCPGVHEVPGQMGADFPCSPPAAGAILVEVTCLNATAVTTKSGWTNKLDKIAGHLAMVTPQLMVKAGSKVRQLSAAPAGIPGIVAICLVHPAASLLLSTLAAKWMLLSDPVIRVPIAVSGEVTGATQAVTDLRYSVFFEPQDGVIVPVRQSVSAILLVALWEEQSEIVGLLHPKPMTFLNYRIFQQVPFLRVEWPLTNPVGLDWIIGDPCPRRVDHRRVSLTDAGFRGE